MSELDANLTQLRTSFDEIEKRIKAIERQVTANTQLTATKACLEEIKILLEDYQNAYQKHLENYNNHSIDFNLHKQESIQNITDLQSASSMYGASINTLTTKANTIQSTLERLSTRVLALEQNPDNGNGSSTQASDVSNWEDIVYFNFAQEINNPTTTETFYFIPTIFDCTPGYVDVEMTFEMEANSSVDCYAILTINNETLPQQQIPSFTGKNTICYKKQFLTNKSVNAIKMAFKVPRTKIVLTNFNIKIHAKNVKIFNRFQPVEIFCFNNNYYITDMSNPNTFYYGIVSKENFSYDKSKLNAVNYSDIGPKHFATKLVPSIENGNTIQLKTTNDGTYLVAYSLGSLLTYYTTFEKLTDATTYTKYCNSSSITTYSDDFYPFGINQSTNTYHHFVCLGDRVRAINTKGSYSSLTLNDVMLTDYNYIYVVRDNNLKIGDTMPPFRGSVICRSSDNMFVYFPEKDSNYCVEIAKGKNATAYYQPDGSIFVYINRGHQVFKYKLQKNENEQYECIGATDVYDNIIKYEELYDGHALVKTIDSYKII